MAIVKTSDLIGPALDWAVAKCKGLEIYKAWPDEILVIEEVNWIIFSPSTDWSQGGPIIEREGIDTWCILVGRPDHKDPAWRKSHWRAKYSRMGFGTDHVDAETPLIAAMRCYVASKLGDTVEVPEELL